MFRHRPGASEQYVRWVNSVTNKWATWEPGDLVDLGDIGHFDSRYQFISDTDADTLLQVRPTVRRTNIAPRSYFSTHYFKIDAGVDAKIPPVAGAAIEFRLTKGSGHFLYLGGGHTEEVRNEGLLLDAIKTAIINGSWCLGWLLVGERVRVTDGFAVKCTEKGTGFTVSVKGDFPIDHVTSGNLARAELALGGRSGRGTEWTFRGGETPIFDRVWRVRPNLIKTLYGDNPKGVPPHSLVYRSTHSRIDASKLQGMTVNELLETEFVAPVVWP